MKIAIFGRVTDQTDFRILADFFAFLRAKGLTYIIFRDYALEMAPLLPQGLVHPARDTFTQREEIADCKFLFCFGGDGTVLEAVRFSGDLGIPILGVNFGRLGYLTSVPQTELISATTDLLKDNYRIDQRALLSVVSDPPGLFEANPFGINDLTIHKLNTNEMITVRAFINGEFLNNYWGDGLIVATPTGSTAYSLSCGGPIMFPTSQTFVITPVAPHSLTVRPVVIPDSWVVSFEIQSRSGEAMVALDTRTEPVKSGTSIAVRKAPFKVSLLRMTTARHVDNLRRSLMWGSDYRN